MTSDEPKGIPERDNSYLEEESAKLPRQNIYESGVNVGTGQWGSTPQKYVKREDYAEVERSNVILEKNVRDLQKQLNQAHKRIATLVDQNTSGDTYTSLYAELADRRLDAFEFAEYKEEEGIDIWVKDDNGDLIYSEWAQDQFIKEVNVIENILASHGIIKE